MLIQKNKTNCKSNDNSKIKCNYNSNCNSIMNAILSQN